VISDFVQAKSHGVLCCHGDAHILDSLRSLKNCWQINALAFELNVLRRNSLNSSSTLEEKGM